jgi:hypothetical protein
MHAIGLHFRNQAQRLEMNNGDSRSYEHGDADGNDH